MNKKGSEPRKRGQTLGVVAVILILGFEILNYLFTGYGFNDVLGSLTFAGIRWAVILAIAFCGIDIAGIVRLFTPEQWRDESAEAWYLFGGWLLAAAINAIVVWWGITLALSTYAVGFLSEELIRTLPIFAAGGMWVIRIFIIGSASVAGDRFAAKAKTVQPR